MFTLCVINDVIIYDIPQLKCICISHSHSWYSSNVRLMYLHIVIHDIPQLKCICISHSHSWYYFTVLYLHVMSVMIFLNYNVFAHQSDLHDITHLYCRAVEYHSVIHDMSHLQMNIYHSYVHEIALFALVVKYRLFLRNLCLSRTVHGYFHFCSWKFPSNWSHSITKLWLCKVFAKALKQMAESGLELSALRLWEKHFNLLSHGGVLFLIHPGTFYL